MFLQGIVHFEINFWYVLAYLKGIQDDFDIFRSNRSCLSEMTFETLLAKHFEWDLNEP